MTKLANFGQISNYHDKGIGGDQGQKKLFLVILIHVIALSFFFPKLGHMFLNYQNFLFYERLSEGYSIKCRKNCI